MKTKTLPYEEAAERRTVEGWVCKTCNLFYGNRENAEHAARYCCAKDTACKCGKRMNMHYTICQDCRDKKREAEWLAKPTVQWDGEFPIAFADDDKYFWDHDSVCDWIGERAAEDADFDPLALHWTTCEPSKSREFEGADHFSDDLPEDDDTDFTELDKFVNEWVKDHLPKLFYPTQKRIDPECIRRAFEVDEILKEVRA